MRVTGGAAGWQTQPMAVFEFPILLVIRSSASLKTFVTGIEAGAGAPGRAI